MIVLAIAAVIAVLVIAHDIGAILQEKREAEDLVFKLTRAKIEDDTWERWVADVESRGGEEL